MNKKILVGLLAVIVAIGAYFAYGVFFGPETQEGTKTVTIEIVVDSEEINKTYTFKTDTEFLYDLLLENEQEIKLEILDSSFGPMLTGLEGYSANESKQEFYHISINGEAAMVGIKDIPVLEGDVYRFEIMNW